MGLVILDLTAEGLAGFGLVGENDAFEAGRLREVLAGVAEAGVVVDLSRAVSIDATVALTILEGARAAAAQDRSFVVLVPENASDHLRGLLALTQLDRLLPLVRTWEEALGGRLPERRTIT